MTGPLISITFKAPAPMAEQIDRAAHAQLLSRSDIIRRALLAALAETRS